MRVGVLDVIVLPSTSLMDRLYHVAMTKQFASIVPQVISTWCRQLGHEAFYATHYGVGDVFRLLPDHLDVVFIGCCSLASPLAYALAKFYRKVGTLTVIGGPHAEAFPVDCLRFFDLVIGDCDKTLVANIVDGQFARGQYISASKPFENCPTVEERMPEIKAAAFFNSRWPSLMTMVPMLTSRGCPYTCDFCRDWDNEYHLLSMERLAADIRYVSQCHPNFILGFNDPNFGIQFEKVFQVLESVPPESRVRYGMECSLSILNESRLKRLRETNCVLSIHGVESWKDYSTKAGVKNRDGIEKVNLVAEQLKQVHEYIPYIQVGLIFGLDSDFGDEPILLSKQFVKKTPFAWPVFNIPMPFGGTPMFEQYMKDGRILKAMPFAFYSFPYLAFVLKNYDPISYFEKLIELSECVASLEMLSKRIQSTSNWRMKTLHWVRTQGEKTHQKKYREILMQLKTDSHFLAFHEGKSKKLPDFYRHQLKVMLGRYAELLSPEELHPCLDQQVPKIVGSTVGGA
jgi:hypothetical protein